MPTNKEIDAALRVATRIAEMIKEHYAELLALGQDQTNALFNAHLPLFSVINATRESMKRHFVPAVLKHFDEMIDTLIDEEAH